MPSQKPKLQGVIDDDLYSEFKAYKESINAQSDSAALNSLLHEFFRGSPKTPAFSPKDSDTLKNLSNVVNSINNKVIPNISSDIQVLTDKLNKQQEMIDYLLSHREQPKRESDNGDKRNHLIVSEVIASDNGNTHRRENSLDSPGAEDIKGDNGDIQNKEDILTDTQSKDITSNSGVILTAGPENITSEVIQGEQGDTSDNNDIYPEDITSEVIQSGNDDILTSDDITSKDIAGDNSDKGDKIIPEDITSEVISGNNSDILTIENITSQVIQGDKSNTLNPEDTLNNSIHDNIASDNSDKSFKKKTYRDAIAIIKQMVLIERVPQKDVIAFLNSQDYPTATGVGEWTANKVSKEVIKLRKMSGISNNRR